MEVKINFEEFKAVNRVLNEIKSVNFIPGKEYVLVLDKSQKSCGVYQVNYSFDMYKNKLDSNNQGYIYLGKADARGRLTIEKSK